jgi:hypothetical protein
VAVAGAQLTGGLAVDIPSVVDVYDVNPILLYVYFVDDAVAATSSGTQPGELAAQLSA